MKSYLLGGSLYLSWPQKIIYKKGSLLEFSLSCFSDSLNRKRLPSDLASVHTRKSIWIDVYVWPFSLFSTHMDYSWKIFWVFLSPFSHSLNLLEKCCQVYCLSSDTCKSMERYHFGIIFSSFQTRLIILWKETSLEFSFSYFSNSLNMKNT